MEELLKKIENGTFSDSDMITDIFYKYWSKPELDIIVTKLKESGYDLSNKEDSLNVLNTFKEVIRELSLGGIYMTYRNINRIVTMQKPSVAKRCSAELISFIIPNRGGKNIDKVVSNINKIYDRFEKEIIIIEQCDDAPFKRGQLYNEAVKRCNGKYIALLDNDIISENYINLIATYKKFGKPYLLFSEINQISYLNEEEYEITETNPSSGGYGGFLFCTKKDFETANGFSNLCAGWGYEDNVLDYRFCGMGSIKNTISHITHPKRNNNNTNNTNLNGRVYLEYLDGHIQKEDDGMLQTISELVYDKEEWGVRYIGVKDVGVVDDFKFQMILDLHQKYMKEAEMSKLNFSEAVEDNERKLCILIESDKKHIGIEKHIRNLWYKKAGDNVKVIFYRTGYPEFKYDVQNGVFELPVDEKMTGKYISLIFALSASKGLKCDFTLLTTIHDYLNISLIKKLMSKTESESDTIYTSNIKWDKKIASLDKHFIMMTSQTVDFLTENTDKIWDVDYGYGVSMKLYDESLDRLAVCDRALKVDYSESFEEFYTKKNGLMFVTCECVSENEEKMKFDILSNIIDNKDEKLTEPKTFVEIEFENKKMINVDGIKNILNNLN